MRIASIAERPDLVETVAQWQFDEWGPLEPGVPLSGWAASLARQAADPGRIPATFVALDGEEPLGAASVVREEGHGELTPRLACVYVLPSARGRRVATNLVRHVMAQTAILGVSRLYLVTEGARGLYEKLGWQVIGTNHHAGMDVTIMAIDLTPDAARDPGEA